MIPIWSPNGNGTWWTSKRSLKLSEQMKRHHIFGYQIYVDFICFHWFYMGFFYLIIPGLLQKWLAHGVFSSCPGEDESDRDFDGGIHLALITHRGCNKKHLFRPCSSVLGDGFMMVLWWFLIWDETWCWNFLNTTLNQFTDNNNCSLQQPPILRIEHGNDMRPLPFCLIPKHPYINIPEFRRWDRGTYHPSSCRTPSWYWSQKKIKEGEKRRPWKNSLQSFVCEKEPCLFLQEPTCYNLLRVPSIWRWRIPLQDWIG